MENLQEYSVIKEFDKKAYSYTKSYSGHSGTSHSFNIRKKRVCEMVEDVRGDKVLDIGCGPGVMVEELISKGFEFYGVDISSKMIELCKNRFGNLENAHFYVGKIENLDFPDDFFDLIICMGVMEYISDDIAALKEVKRVLKPNGVLVVTLPNRLSPYRIWGKLFFNRFVLTLIKKFILQRKDPIILHKEYREKKIRQMLISYGLGVVDVVYYNFNILPFPLDRLFPNITVFLSSRLESLCRSRLRYLGTGFIVKAKKS